MGFYLRLMIYCDFQKTHEPFKRQPHKMVKHTQAKADELFECL